MNNNILSVNVNNTDSGRIVKDDRGRFIFNYSTTANPGSYVSLTMPVRADSFVNDTRLHPIFEMHLPEGYLLAVIKKHFTKITPTDDFGLLNLVSENISGRISYNNAETIQSIGLEDLLHPASKNLFNELVSRFALTSALSGVQPKVMAKVQEKATLALKDYIVKSWGEDYPSLAINEYYCMKVMEGAGVATPQFHLSDDDALFVVKRFDINSKGEFLGFEDMCVLQARSKDDKYEGSYERIARTIKDFVTPKYKKQSFMQFFKMMVINTLVRNGDAHLKNFGLLYDDIDNIKIAPAFDVVHTTVYIKDDIPALNMLGSKKWHNQEKLLKFGTEFCDLSKKEAVALYDECLKSLVKVTAQVEERLAIESSGETRAFLIVLQEDFHNSINTYQNKPHAKNILPSGSGPSL